MYDKIDAQMLTFAFFFCSPVSFVHNPQGYFTAFWGNHSSVSNAALTHLPLDKMVAIAQTTFSYAFSWLIVFNFDYNFTAICSLWSDWQ